MNKNIGLTFNDQAAGRLPETDFFTYLAGEFNRDTALRVWEAFQKMNLPPPQKEAEFLKGLEGGLVFLNKYGLVIRIEIAEADKAAFGPDRIDDNAWILKPLASIDAGKAVIEICPGCHQATSKAQNEGLRDRLQKQNIDFWDYKFSNIGHIPIKTVHFPEGVPIVIDRLAARRLTESIEPIHAALQSMNNEVIAAQEKLYAPLRQAFDEAWQDAKKMEQFWTLCQGHVQEGKLVAGWNERQADEASTEQCKWGSNRKTLKAAEAAKCYEIRLNSADQSAHPGAMQKLFGRAISLFKP